MNHSIATRSPRGMCGLSAVNRVFVIGDLASATARCAKALAPFFHVICAKSSSCCLQQKVPTELTNSRTFALDRQAKS
jgi:hypothetical protein